MRKRPMTAALLSPVLLAFAAPAFSATPTASGAQVEPDREISRVVSDSKFAKATASLEGDYERIIEDIIALTEIPAPPFKEEARARAYMAMLQAEGLSDVEMDAVGNVMGLRKGSGDGPLIVVAAHLDTVFPEGTPVTVRRGDGVLHAPGIGDDTSSLPVLLGFARAMDRAGYSTQADILFVGNVGEEGPGDLRGVRHLFTKGKYKDRIGYFISFESGKAGRITNAGTGSRRYKVTFNGPGGHSMGDFGVVSPAFAMANAMTAFGALEVPKEPRTVFNVGIVEGGTSVNSIPFATAMTVDMRSNGQDSLDTLEKAFLDLLPEAVARENAARSTQKGAITYEAEMIGNRPVGETSRSARLISLSVASARASGYEPTYATSSTDANLPMSMGIEAVTLRTGFDTFRLHSLEEGMYLKKEEDLRGMQTGLATLLALSGAH